MNITTANAYRHSTEELELALTILPDYTEQCDTPNDQLRGAIESELERRDYDESDPWAPRTRAL